MRAKLGELGELLMGAAWWGGSHLWGVALGAMLLLAPLLLANLAVEVIGSLSGTAAMVIGVIGAYAVGLPPWDAEERYGLPLVIGGTTGSVVGWELVRGSADAGTLLIALAVTLVGWRVRRAIASNGRVDQRAI
jgi:hypothetical protein